MGGVIYLFFLLEKKMRIGRKKEREKGKYCGEKTPANIWVFFFLMGKIKTFGHIYMNELNFVTHIFIHTIPKVTQIMT